MPSYQDIEQRLQIIEEKVDLLMRSISIQRVEGVVDKKVVTKTLLDLYRDMKSRGVMLTTEKTAETTTELVNNG